MWFRSTIPKWRIPEDSKRLCEGEDKQVFFNITFLIINCLWETN